MAENPDIDDLDKYLDDVLDEFTPEPSAPVAPPMEAISAPSASAPSAGQDIDDDFARQLAANMEQFLRGNLGGEDEEAADFKSTMEQIVGAFKDLQTGDEGAASAAGGAPKSVPAASPPAAAASGSTGGAPKSFQDKVSETMSRLRDSDQKAEQLAAELAQSSGLGLDDEAVEQMMKELEGLMGSGDFEGAFGGIMEQLMSKELLHEPMRDLAGKYPEWLEANASKLSPEELDKYRQQHVVIKEIVAIYDACPTEAASEEDSKKVVDLMQRMQDLGNPPEEILQELAPGLEIGPDGMPQMPAGGMAGLGGQGQECIIQ
ncbi:Peroxisome chaperone and import receptor [Borealophlyctis nickersoniae]|nr:Peroxisome chaperone and import receptor [Borealophlyctis nickersoniae]